MSNTHPLEGVTVVEIGHSVAAPFAGLILGNLGARVIKVENPGRGDHARGWGPPFLNDTAAYFMPYNREKPGVTVDLADADQVARLERLILDEADVVIQNLKDGAIERFGLGAAQLREKKPSLIYANIGAFGKGGPLSEKPGYDPLMQAAAGIMSVTGEYRRPPVRVGVSLVDIGSGMWSVIGILSALLNRQKNESGVTIDTSLFETAIAWMTSHLAAYEVSGEVRPSYGSGVAEIVPYQAFQTRDGWMMISAGNDGLFIKLCKALGLAEILDNPLFARNASRVAHRNELVPALEAAIKPMSTSELGDALNAYGVPNAPVKTIDELISDPQLAAIGILQDGPAGKLRTVGLPLSFDGVRPPYRRGAPSLGEHNELVFGSEEVADS